MKRVLDEPAYVLHRYDWSESSLILEAFTRHQGRIAIVAKGAKRPSSNFRSVLLPLQPLRLTFAGDAEIRTLRGAEWVGGHVMPTGDALLSGYYVNELLLRLLAREDPHPVLFDAYAQTVRALAAEDSQASSEQSALRTFELLLLREIGLLPQLDVQTLTLQALEPHTSYALVPEGGLLQAGADTRVCLDGQHWQQLQYLLDEPLNFAALRSVCAEVMGELKPQLRALLHYHCGVSTLRTRQMMLDVQTL